MSVKSQFYQLNKEQFEEYLNGLKNADGTVHLLKNTDTPYFYHHTQKVNELLLAVNKSQWEFDRLIDGFSDFAKKQLVQSFLIDEIESTNKIENIYSTRHDIFSVMRQAKSIEQKKIVSIVNAYEIFLGAERKSIKTLKDIREVYDLLMKDALEKDDRPDGEYFRKNPVQISDGIKMVHTGLYGEQNINEAMTEFLTLYNAEGDAYERMILCHFILENIHPYYDGNGRLGRFLFSNGLFLSNNTYFSFLIAKAFSVERDRYYAAFKRAHDLHEFGCLNDFMESILAILNDELARAKKDLNVKKERILNFVKGEELTKSEQAIYTLIAEASVLSDYGISNEEIKKELLLSQRTLIYTMNKFRELNLLIDTKIGKVTYHKLKN